MQLTFDDNLEEYMITLHHTTLTGLGSGISRKSVESFSGSIGGAKKHADRILKKHCKKPVDWVRLGKTHVRISEHGNPYSVSIIKESDREQTLDSLLR